MHTGLAFFGVALNGGGQRIDHYLLYVLYLENAAAEYLVFLLRVFTLQLGTEPHCHQFHLLPMALPLSRQVLLLPFQSLVLFLESLLHFRPERLSLFCHFAGYDFLPAGLLQVELLLCCSKTLHQGCELLLADGEELLGGQFCGWVFGVLLHGFPFEFDNAKIRKINGLAK
ncbi:MAG: hypothetical protein IJJ98_15075 [Prevotella sp.]|nr:hypothetical protein [Prevotella sp.]